MCMHTCACQAEGETCGVGGEMKATSFCCVAVCVLQCVAVCCSVWQCVAVRCSAAWEER